MSDLAQIIQDRKSPADPLQQEYLELKQQRARIDQRIKELQTLLTSDICEECGALFTRLRLNKTFCSQRCTMRASLRRRKNKAFDIDLICKHIDRIERGGLMTQRQVAIVRDYAGGAKGARVAELFAISKQHVSQVMKRANKFARLIEVMREDRLDTAAEHPHQPQRIEGVTS